MCLLVTQFGPTTQKNLVCFSLARASKPAKYLSLVIAISLA